MAYRWVAIGEGIDPREEKEENHTTRPIFTINKLTNCEILVFVVILLSIFEMYCMLRVALSKMYAFLSSVLKFPFSC